MRQKKSRKAARDSVNPEIGHAWSEDPLEKLLDAESDEEFGKVEIRNSTKSWLSKPVKLAEWSARDFSSIYLRFRPHLERHARRFLSNPSQVDEVVQDAFLYLMVSLPELDSEIGVLKFLKWKTRLLAFDVIRASGRAQINSLDDIQEPASSEPEVSSYLEAQDDAAVVKLALAKLHPRHREVLIASMYEEKSTQQIAHQVGLSENATRQLIFRARSAFKKALVGDVDTTGMSAAAILSVAARKAASEGKKIGSAALTILALFLLSVSFWPTINRAQQEVAGSNGESTSPTINVSPDTSPSTGIEKSVTPEPSQSSSNQTKPKEKSITNKEARRVLTDPEKTEVVYDLGTNPGPLLQLGNMYTISSDAGVVANFNFNSLEQETSFKEVSLSFELDENLFVSEVKRVREISFIGSDSMQRFVFVGEIEAPLGVTAEIWNSSSLSKSIIRIEVAEATSTGQLALISLSISPAS